MQSIVLITGASGGIGRALAHQLHGQGLRMPAMREGAARQYPLGGIQSAEQVADVMAFLRGVGAARLTGQVIAVDGGFTTVSPLVR
jgi:NAD(P)-dependent dehydrogenase (short-subunit alcohol dehydrogenase family)